MLTAALLVAGLMADDPVTPTIPATSPVAQIITVTLAGVASIIVAAAGFANLRKRRQAEADSTSSVSEVVIPVDLEDRPSRLRERLTVLETRLDTRGREWDRRLVELEEAMTLRRAADIALESEQAPRRRRRAPSD